MPPHVPTLLVPTLLVPTLLVVQPDAGAPLDRFERWLTEAGVRWQTVRPAAGEPVPDRLTTAHGAADGLLVLGGAMSANDDADHPWLEDIRALQRDAVRAWRPTLGICLGAQLLAQALGGRVVRGAAGLEAGLVTVEAHPAAEDDALLAGLGPRFASVSLHGDAIDVLPSDAVLLASSAQYPHQAFRTGPRAWGVQFHPEASPATYASWTGLYRGDEKDIARVAAGIDAVHAHAEATEDVSRRLALAFVAQLHRNPAAPGAGPGARP